VDEEESEFLYFTPDRLVGVLRISDPDEPVSSAHVYALIHLTSRFGPFIREGSRWEPLWQGWNPDPSLKYINFKTDSYDRVVRAFDQSDEDYLYFDEFGEHQDVLNWEGSFDNTTAPECFRDIDELINWIQDFTEPKPEIITYGSGRISCGDMAWMYPYVEELKSLRESTEDYVLSQRRKSSEVVLDEKLMQIEMYPPLHEMVIEAYYSAASAADSEESLDEFDQRMNKTAFMKYFKGGRASIRELNYFHLDLLAEMIDMTRPISQREVDAKVLVRESSTKPENRLEAWFIHGQETELYQLIANTKMGLFSRYGKGQWRPVIRSRDEEDVYDLNGVTIIHLRPERELEIIKEFDAGKLHEIHIKNPALNKFKVEYRGENPSGFDFYDRVNHNDKSPIKFSDLNNLAARIVREMVSELKTRINDLREEKIEVGILPSNLAVLEAFIKNEIDFTYSRIHALLIDSVSGEIDTETIHLTAGEFARRSAKERFEKIIQSRNVEYLPLGSLMLVVAYEPATTMWLEYRSQSYGSFARIDGGWRSGNSQDSALYKELFLYEVKEECVSDFIAAYDAVSEDDGWSTFEELAPMLCFYRINHNRAGDVFNPRDWDAEPFMRDQMPPSAAAVVEYLYNSVMTFINDYSEAHEDDDDDSWMQVDEWLAQIWADHMIEFMNRESTLNRSLLGRFLDAAPRILQDPRNVIRE
jgi:hypothetical protein